MPDGAAASLGVMTGGLIPLFPVGVAMAMKKELSGRTAKIVGLSTMALFIGSFVHGYYHREKE
jgi:hypothetical protein